MPAPTPRPCASGVMQPSLCRPYRPRPHSQNFRWSAPSGGGGPARADRRRGRRRARRPCRASRSFAPGEEVVPHAAVDDLDVVRFADDAPQLALRSVEVPLAADDVDVFEPIEVVELAEDVDLALLAVDLQEVDARKVELREQLRRGDRIRELPRAIGALEFVARVDVVPVLAAIEAEHREVLRASAARRVLHEHAVVLLERLEAVDRGGGEVLRGERGEGADVRADVDDDPRREAGADELVHAIAIGFVHLVADGVVDAPLALLGVHVQMAFAGVENVGRCAESCAERGEDHRSIALDDVAGRLAREAAIEMRSPCTSSALQASRGRTTAMTGPWNSRGGVSYASNAITSCATTSCRAMFATMKTLIE